MRLRFFIFLIGIMFFTGGVLDAKLIDIYKKGVIRLSVDPSFGKGTDWVELIYDSNHGIIMAPDGSFFMSNSRQHNLSKFNLEGKYLFTFSQLGEGPGDLYYPSKPIILDNRCLIVNEYGERMRFSIFDFSGKFVKIIRVKHSPSNLLPLRDNIVVYRHKQPIPTPGPKITKTDIYTVNVITGNETLLMTLETPRDYVSNGKGYSISFNNGYPYLERTKNGNLLVGLSHQPDIKIFSPDGKFIKSFKVNIRRLRNTDEIRKKRREKRLADIDNWKGLSPQQKNKLKYGPLPPDPDYFPYYRDIMVDAEGNILLHKWTECVGDECPLVFNVYSPEGVYVCDFRIEKYVNNFSFSNLLFTERGIFALVSYDDGEDTCYKLARIIPK